MDKAIRKFKSKTPKKWKYIQRSIIAIGSAMAVITVYPEYFSFLPEFITKTISACALLGAILIQFKSEENDNISNDSDIPQN